MQKINIKIRNIHKTALRFLPNPARGFTLIETLVAITILTLSIVAPMSVATQSLSSSYYARDQVTAFHLAQEAIESVRSLRDNNILRNARGEEVDILEGIPENPFIIDTRDNSVDESACVSGCPPLETDGTFYGYGGSGWEPTRFTRTVDAEFVDAPDEMRIDVTVSWQTGSFQPRTFSISENMYRWVPDLVDPGNYAQANYYSQGTYYSQSGYYSQGTYYFQSSYGGGFPQVSSTNSITFNNDTTTHNVPMPATVDSGDLLIVFFTNDGSASVTTPSGWTQLFSASQSSNVRGGVYARAANGSEDSTNVDFVTSASEQAAAQVYRITSWGGGTVANGVAVGTAVAASGSNANPPLVQPTAWGTANTLWMVYAGFSSASGSGVVSSYPSNYSSGATVSSGSSTSGAQTAVARRNLNADQEDPGSFSSGSSAYVVNSIAVRPATI